MSSEIQTLPDEVIDLIAAGEVIDSLAAVVRELVENSLDAGANRITVSLYPELWQVQVIDNGQGMSLDDLRICATAHSTSKIRSCRDLWHITSLGFRGEALHSISQVADLNICSRTKEELGQKLDPIGWRVSYREGKSQQESAVAIAIGTIITVSNLFAKIPVRRRGLPTLPQQLKAIQKLICQVALCHPQITWQVKNNNRPWFYVSPGATAKDILPQFLKKINSGDLHHLSLEIPTPNLEANKNLNKNSPKNSNKYIASAAVSNLVDEPRHQSFNSYKSQSQDHQDHQLSPSCSTLFAIEEANNTNNILGETNNQQSSSQIELILGLPNRCHRHRPDWVKVSVNNRFVRSPELEQTILSNFAQTLPRNRFPVCILHIHTCPSQIDWNRHPAKTEIYLHALPYWQAEISRAIARALKLNTASLPQEVGNQRLGKVIRVAEASGKYQIDRDLTKKLEEQTPLLPQTQLNSLKLTAVAQVNKTYIVAEHPGGVWLIEQHIAHERVLYEQLQSSWELVPLASSIALEYLRSPQLEQLEKLGIEVELFGENTWAIRNAPKILAERDDCADALVELSWGGDLRSAQVASACRSAIRNGKILNLQEMQNLLDLWQATRNPRTCPHGRPIYLSLEETTLSRFFRRHWVIGKSHGI